MFPDIERKVTFNYSRATILSAIVKICQEKKEYELLEEVSNHALQIFVQHYSEVLKKQTGYYLNLTVKETADNLAELSVETEQGFQPLDAATYLDINKILREFLFILRQYLKITSGKG